MGAKFYRGSDKPKKIRKRFSQTRSWFRTLKWVACKSRTSFSKHSVPSIDAGCTIWLDDSNVYLLFRSRSPNNGCRSPLQGFMGVLHRSTLAPRPEALRHAVSSAVQASLPRQEPLRPPDCCFSASILWLLLGILRPEVTEHLQRQVQQALWKHEKGITSIN